MMGRKRRSIPPELTEAYRRGEITIAAIRDQTGISQACIWEKLKDAGCQMAPAGPRAYVLPEDIAQAIKDGELTKSEAARRLDVPIFKVDRAFRRWQRGPDWHRKERRDKCDYNIPSELIEQYKKRELTIEQIAEKLGKSFNETRLALKRQRVKLLSSATTLETIQRDDQLFYEYQDGASIIEIARKHQIPDTYVWKRVDSASKRLGISKRPPYPPGKQRDFRYRMKPDGTFVKEMSLKDSNE